MTDQDLWAVHLGNPITPSKPYSVRRRRLWRMFLILALCAVSFGALMGLSH